MAIDSDRSVNLVQSLKDLDFPAEEGITAALLGYHGLQPTMTVGDLVVVASRARAEIEDAYQSMLGEIDSRQTKVHIITAILGNIYGDDELIRQREELARPLGLKFDYRDLPEHLCGLLATEGFVNYLTESGERNKD